jgi:vesicular inhibitory amino acid transporter
MDLLSTPGYNSALNEAALWMLVLSPLCVFCSPPLSLRLLFALTKAVDDRSKFALTTQPLNTAIQILIGIDSPIGAPEELAAKLAEPHRGSRFSIKGALGVLQRVIVTLLSVAVSILVPEFSAAS